MKSWLTTTDHKRIGLLYFWTAFSFFLIGGVEALFIRAQLAQPNGHLEKRERGPEVQRSEEHTSELQSQSNLVCRLLLEKKKNENPHNPYSLEFEIHKDENHATPTLQHITRAHSRLSIMPIDTTYNFHHRHLHRLVC